MEPGDYGMTSGGWRARPPWPHGVANITGHSVTAHDDGTLTVSPSILVSLHNEAGETVSWHGYLERGVWREC